MDERNKICIENVRPHPNPMASQARHESVSPEETSASRYVVPQERGKNRHSHGSGVQCAISLSGICQWSNTCCRTILSLKHREDTPSISDPAGHGDTDNDGDGVHV